MTFITTLPPSRARRAPPLKLNRKQRRQMIALSHRASRKAQKLAQLIAARKRIKAQRSTPPCRG